MSDATLYHVTTVPALARITDQGLIPTSDEHAEHVYLFSELDAALRFAERYYFTGQMLANGAAVRPAAQPLLLFVDGDGLELEPDPMRPPLPHSFRTAGNVEPERLLASARLAHDGAKVCLGRLERIWP